MVYSQNCLKYLNNNSTMSLCGLNLCYIETSLHWKVHLNVKWKFDQIAGMYEMINHLILLKVHQDLINSWSENMMLIFDALLLVLQKWFYLFPPVCWMYREIGLTHANKLLLSPCAARKCLVHSIWSIALSIAMSSALVELLVLSFALHDDVYVRAFPILMNMPMWLLMPGCMANYHWGLSLGSIVGVICSVSFRYCMTLVNFL